tara:strand:+ start:10290 stop:10661 length:372 start_codon:yes stop_codon:yes gene_type:complete
MVNPYSKYLGKEDKLQNSVMTYLKYKYPKALFSHISNEGKRTPFERYKMKYLGSKPGLPDVMIFTPNKHYNGLAIELKVGYNKPSENQKNWLMWLEKANWKAIWLNDFDKCIDTIDNYFKDAK